MAAARGRTNMPSLTPRLPQTRSGLDEGPEQPALSEAARSKPAIGSRKCITSLRKAIIRPIGRIGPMRPMWDSERYSIRSIFRRLRARIFGPRTQPRLDLRAIVEVGGCRERWVPSPGWTMRRMMLLGLLLLAGCQNTVG